MSFAQSVKEIIKAQVENEIDKLTRPRLFDEIDSDADTDNEEPDDEVLYNRKLDELYDRAPLYVTENYSRSAQIYRIAPNDVEKVVYFGDNNSCARDDPTVLGVYSEEKDSFMLRQRNHCLYFRLKDDTKRRLVKRYIKENLNEVAQMVQEENQKIFQASKASFEKLSAGAIVCEANLDAQSSQ